MASGLKKWFGQKWVNIGAKKKNGRYPRCGRPKAKLTGRGYPKCVPAAKARSMSASQRASAVSRKKKAESKGRTGKKPNYART